MTDWNAIKANVEVRGRSKTESVARYNKILKEIMADGQDYTVAKLRAWLDAGLNEGKTGDEPKVKVNWMTVKYAMDGKAGFKEVAHNVFRYEAPKKKDQAAKK
jgi:hypothetical protein